jgi:hypothetical protein
VLAGSLAAGPMTFVDGDTDAPVVGANVTVAGRSYTTDASGAINVPEPVDPNAQVEVAAPGYLKRETLVRTDTRFALWPDRSGFNAAWTQESVYFPGFTQDNKLTRPGGGLYVVLAPEVKAAAGSVFEEAAGLITAANGGRIPFVITDAPPPGAPTIKVSINGSDTFFATNTAAAAYARVPYLGNVVGGDGSIVFKTDAFAKLRVLVAHELGHHFGLGHPASQPAVMNAAVDTSRSDFAAAEKLSMKMMLRRRAGNAYPDNDRAVISGAPVIASRSREQSHLFFCYVAP